MSVHERNGLLWELHRCGRRDPFHAPDDDCDKNTAVQTRAEISRQAVVDHGYEEFAAISDQLFDNAGRDLCDLARQEIALVGDPLLRRIGKGFVQGFNENAETSLTPQDGAVIVELILTVYCPEVL